MLPVDTTNMCSHLQRKLFEEDGVYHPIWLAMQENAELTAVVRSRQLHIYRNGKKCWYWQESLHPRLSKRINFMIYFIENVCLFKIIFNYITF